MEFNAIVFVLIIIIGIFENNNYVLGTITSDVDDHYYQNENLLTTNINCTTRITKTILAFTKLTQSKEEEKEKEKKEKDEEKDDVIDNEDSVTQITFTYPRTVTQNTTKIITSPSKVFPCSTLTFISNIKTNTTRIRRNVSPFEEDEIGWTNINEEADMALKTIWPYFIEHGYTTLALPDITDTISVKPLLITYSASLKLTNGHLYNIEGLQRSGDAYMTYIDKSFQFRLNLVIRSQQFVYDFLVGILGIEAGGTVNGFLENTIVTGDFSIRGTDANLKLNDFQILSFGNMNVSITHNRIIRQLSSMILTPITNWFKDRITTTISDAIRLQLSNLMDDINNNDTLELKKFLNNTLSGLVG